MKTTLRGWLIVSAALLAVLCGFNRTEAQGKFGRPNNAIGGNTGMPRPGTNVGGNTTLGRPNNFSGNTGMVGGNPNNKGGFVGNPPAQPGTALGNNNGGMAGQPNNFAGQPNNFAGQPNNFAGQPNNFAGQPNNFAGQPKNFAGQPNNFAGQPNNFAGNQPNIPADPWAGNQQVKQDVENAGRKATGGMIAMGIMSLLVGLAILGCLGWMVFMNNAHSAAPVGGSSSRRAGAAIDERMRS